MRNIWPGSRSVAIWLVLAIIAASTIVRFVKLESAPGGFFIDESDGMVHIMCLGQTGHDGWGVPHPVFAAGGAGGYFSPVHLYAGVLWTKIFGTSIYAIRAMEATMTTLAMLGLFFLANNLLDRKAALLVVLAACVSPWAFPFARQHMDDPTMFPLGVVWGTYYFIRSHRIRDAILSALFYSIAFYAYGPSRLQVPLLGLALLFYKRRRQGIKPEFLTAFVLAGVFFCIPLIKTTLSGEAVNRYNVVGIFSPYYRDKLGTNTVLGGITVFLKNYFLHFEPRFLFISGDKNLRHSSQFSGEFSWLDDIALLAGIALLVRYYLAKKKAGALQKFTRIFSFSKRDGETNSRQNEAFVIFIVGYFAAIIASALTWESIPHALRCVGCWPFLSLITGFVLWKADRAWKYFLLPATVVAAVFGVLYINNYFTVYPKMSEAWYDVGVKNIALQAKQMGNWQWYLDATKGYGTPLTRRYYLMEYGHMSCDESANFVAKAVNPAGK